jgi:hypothetical protein
MLQRNRLLHDLSSSSLEACCPPSVLLLGLLLALVLPAMQEAGLLAARLLPAVVEVQGLEDAAGDEGRASQLVACSVSFRGTSWSMDAVTDSKEQCKVLAL